MSYPTDRVILFDRSMNPLPELSSSEVFSRMRSEEINGEHELVIVTTRRLEEGWRALTVDGTGKWREWVVTEPDEVHQSGNSAIGTYRFVWSLQYDLTASYAHVDAASIGLGSSMTSQQAAAKVLEGVARWTVGTCDAPDIQDGDGVVLIYESAWSKLSKIVAATGWEVEAEIEVSNIYGVTARNLCLYAHVGSTEATRRFDWGEDVSEIKRTPDPGPYYCRVVPLGRGETEYADDDETTFEWPMDITEETGSPSLYYIEDAEAAAAFRMPDGNGGWWYPTKAVSYDEDDPELLLAAAQDDLLNHTRPNVSYEATVAQFAEAGLDAHGVALGDDIQIVDRGFNPDAALRLQGRVIKIELDELSPESTTVLTIGNLSPNMSSTLTKSLMSLSEKQTQIANAVAKLNTATYVRSLLDRLNQEINATGGYGYLVEGEGFITYDVAVSDPLIGTEATQVVQIKGGSIRIANSKNAGFAGIDDWDWKTVFTSGHVAANLVTAAQITTGYIGNATDSNYWNLDTGDLVLRAIRRYYGSDTYYSNANIGFLYVSDPEINKDATGENYSLWTPRNVYGLKISEIKKDNQGTETDESNIIILANGYDTGNTFNNSKWNSILSSKDLHVWSNFSSTSRSYLYLDSDEIRMSVNNSSRITSDASLDIYKDSYSNYWTIKLRIGASRSTYTLDDSGHDFIGTAVFEDVKMSSLVVWNSKSRAAKTSNYGDRLLYCYETPTPLFGDVGSGTLDGYGLCYIEIDDILTETISQRGSYQVFIQKCGNGDVWVAEKRPHYFVVEGTPGLSFDWELKARQGGFENNRLDDYAYLNSLESSSRECNGITDETKKAYDDLQSIINIAESIYDEELATA